MPRFPVSTVRTILSRMTPSVIFATFLLFQICRLDSATNKFTVIEGDEGAVYIDTDAIVGFSPQPHSGDVSCTTIGVSTGQKVYVKGDVQELLNRVNETRKRR